MASCIDEVVALLPMRNHMVDSSPVPGRRSRIHVVVIVAILVKEGSFVADHIWSYHRWHVAVPDRSEHLQLTTHHHELSPVVYSTEEPRPTRASQFLVTSIQETNLDKEADVSMRDKMIKNAQPFLQPGEQVQAIFEGRVHQHNIKSALMPTAFRHEFVTVAVTDKRILVLDSGRAASGRAKSVMAELPRATPLGPPKGRVHQIRTPEIRINVVKKWHKEIKASDAAIA